MKIRTKKPLILEIINIFYKSNNSIEYQYWITNMFLENFIFIFRWSFFLNAQFCYDLY